MKYLFLALLAACSACDRIETTPAQQVSEVGPVLPTGTPLPIDPRTKRGNGSSLYYDYRIVHNGNAEVFAAEVNQMLDKGYHFRGELRTASGSGIGPTGFEYIQAMSKE